jgi:hypothetical protein
MYQDRLNQMITISQITGMKINADKLIDDFERIWKIRDAFSESIGQGIINEG